MKQFCWKDVEEGQELPSLTKHPTTRQLVKFAGASGDFVELHYDKDAAQRSNLPSVIVHGWLSLGFLAQVVTDWIGCDGWIKKLSASYRSIHLVDQDLTCKGKVARKYEQDGEHLVDCEIWTETPNGQKGVTASATARLPYGPS